MITHTLPLSDDAALTLAFDPADLKSIGPDQYYFNSSRFARDIHQVAKRLREDNPALDVPTSLKAAADRVEAEYRHSMTDLEKKIREDRAALAKEEEHV